jgi:hypothetical protein
MSYAFTPKRFVRSRPAAAQILQLPQPKPHSNKIAPHLSKTLQPIPVDKEYAFAHSDTKLELKEDIFDICILATI